MKTLLYYLFLLIAIALITGFCISENGAMSMPQILSICGGLVLYTIALSLVGEGKTVDEREQAHRYISNRAGLIAGTAIASLGLIAQLFISHSVDYWLLASLIIINLTKIVSLIWLNYKK